MYTERHSFSFWESKYILRGSKVQLTSTNARVTELWVKGNWKRTYTDVTEQDGNWFCVHGSTEIIFDIIPHNYLLTPWCRALLEKLTGLQLVKKFPAFHGPRRFITALTRVRHPSLSWVSTIQSIYPHPTSWSSVLILSTHLRLGLPSGLLPSGFPTKTLYAPSSHPYAPHAQPISTPLLYNK